MAMVVRSAHLAPRHWQDAVAKLVRRGQTHSQRLEPGRVGRAGARTGISACGGSAVSSQVA